MYPGKEYLKRKKAPACRKKDTILYRIAAFCRNCKLMEIGKFHAGHLPFHQHQEHLEPQNVQIRSFISIYDAPFLPPVLDLVGEITTRKFKKQNVMHWHTHNKSITVY